MLSCRLLLQYALPTLGLVFVQAHHLGFYTPFHKCTHVLGDKIRGIFLQQHKGSTVCDGAVALRTAVSKLSVSIAETAVVGNICELSRTLFFRSWSLSRLQPALPPKERGSEWADHDGVNRHSQQ